MKKYGQADLMCFLVHVYLTGNTSLADDEEKKQVEDKCRSEIMKKISVRNGHGGRKMIGFILGTFFGGIVGVFAMCLCQAAGQADKMNCTDHDE